MRGCAGRVVLADAIRREARVSRVPLRGSGLPLGGRGRCCHRDGHGGGCGTLGERLAGAVRVQVGGCRLPLICFTGTMFRADAIEGCRGNSCDPLRSSALFRHRACFAAVDGRVSAACNARGACTVTRRRSYGRHTLARRARLPRHASIEPSGTGKGPGGTRHTFAVRQSCSVRRDALTSRARRAHGSARGTIVGSGERAACGALCALSVGGRCALHSHAVSSNTSAPCCAARKQLLPRQSARSSLERPSATRAACAVSR